MRLCHCNGMTDDVIEKVIETNLEEIRRCTSLLEGCGMVFRQSVQQTRCHTNPFSCTTCFNHMARMLQTGHDLFPGECLPERDRRDCASCPRRAQCGIDLSP